jgi:c-di-GMP-binding flagellar brake protein YcgR
MACQTLLRRKTQLALLASACARHAHSRIRLRRRASATGEAELVALERDAVLAAWTGAGLHEAEVPDQPVQVHFEHDGEHYTFFAVTRGRVGRHTGPEARRLLKLSLPLRLERARDREHLRLALKGGPPLTATFTHVVDDRRQFQATLTDIADGGIGVVAPRGDVTRLYTGDLFWVDVELPGETTRLEFVARLVHLRPIKNTDKLAMGWAFQPADEVSSHERYLRRVKAFIARRQPAPGVRGRR